jgi:transposase
MARYKPYELDLRAFHRKYKNDENGAPAYDPRILLKIVLFAYSKGILSSRRIAEACQQNVVFMALSGDSQPHYTTIADFISGSAQQIQRLFREVLLVCDELGLIGKEMFAIDGCKLPSNASKEWSGTRADFKKKVSKLDRAIAHMLTTHQDLDAKDSEEDWVKRERKQIATLKRQLKKVRSWLDDNDDDKRGPSGKALKSNLTDPDSAKMKTSKGVIQGYDGVAAVDSKHQVIVAAEAWGEAQEHHLLNPMIAAIKEEFFRIGQGKDIFNRAKVKLTADAGFHTNANVAELERNGIDAYLADNKFRQRDPRFNDAARHKSEKPESKRFNPSDFRYDPEHLTCRCPAGRALYLKNRNFQTGGRKAISFIGTRGACGPCVHRAKCLQNPDQKSPRQVYFFTGETTSALDNTPSERMKHKIDSSAGRHIYSQRLGTVEPVFGNITATLGMKRFTLRGRKKVNGQWNLFAIVHNIGKIKAFAPGYT